MSEDFMDLLEKMLNIDQFLRLPLIECTNHSALLNQGKNEDAGGPTDEVGVKKKLKLFQGEMQMYSGIVGLLYIK